MDDALIGKELHGSYRIHRRIAGGSTGVVYEAEQVSPPHARVAVKVLPPGAGEDAVAWERFQQEARSASALAHPHIVQVLEVLPPVDGQAGIAMELLEGEGLGALLQRQGPLTLEQVGQLATQAGEALQAAHDQGLVHRDLEPGKIYLVATPDQSLQVKLLGFGLCWITASRTDPDRHRASPDALHFLAPEQARGDAADAGAATDIYSLAAVIYHGLSGQPPFAPGNPGQLVDQICSGELPPIQEQRPGLTGELQQVLARAMARDPRERPSRVQQLVDPLLAALQGCSDSEPEASSTRPPRLVGRAVTTEPTAVVPCEPPPQQPEDSLQPPIVSGEIEAATRALGQAEGGRPPDSKVELELPAEVDSPLTLLRTREPTLKIKPRGKARRKPPPLPDREATRKVPLLQREDARHKITVVPHGPATRKIKTGPREDPTREMPLGPRGEAARKEKQETPPGGTAPGTAAMATRRPVVPTVTLQVPRVNHRGPRGAPLLLLALLGLALAGGLALLLLSC